MLCQQLPSAKLAELVSPAEEGWVLCPAGSLNSGEHLWGTLPCSGSVLCPPRFSRIRWQQGQPSSMGVLEWTAAAGMPRSKTAHTCLSAVYAREVSHGQGSKPHRARAPSHTPAGPGLALHSAGTWEGNLPALWRVTLRGGSKGTALHDDTSPFILPGSDI